MTDIFEDVEDQVRQDRYKDWAKRYGLWAAGAFALVLLGVGGWQAYKYFNTQGAREQAVAFAAAQQKAREGDIPAAMSEFERLSKDGPQVYRAMAMMERAAALQAQGDLPGALAQFDAAAEAAPDTLMADTARIRAAYIVADTQDFQAVQARLKPLIESEGQVSYLARELLGVEAWEAGDTALARSTLENITLAFDVPQTVRQRVQLALEVIGPAPAQAASTPPAAAGAETSGEPK